MVWLHHIPSFVPRIFGQMLWHRTREERKLYLTFDDGPVPGVTDFVLDELEKRNMLATFFMVGDNIRKHPNLAKQVAQAGHGIGNHTFHHLDGYRKPLTSYLEDVQRCQEEILRATGKKPLFFRPPYGRITRKQFQLISPNYQVVMWDVISGDYDSDQAPERCLYKSKKHTRNGSIVLFHDQEKTATTIKAVLPDYLDFVQLSGFEACTL